MKLPFFERITRKLNLKALPGFDVLGIGSPIYFRKTPSKVFETINRLKGKGQRAFTFYTKGMYSGNVSRKVLPTWRISRFYARRPLRSLYARVVFGDHCNLCLRCIHPAEVIQLGRKMLKNV